MRVSLTIASSAIVPSATRHSPPERKSAATTNPFVRGCLLPHATAFCLVYATCPGAKRGTDIAARLAWEESAERFDRKSCQMNSWRAGT